MIAVLVPGKTGAWGVIYDSAMNAIVGLEDAEVMTHIPKNPDKYEKIVIIMGVRKGKKIVLSAKRAYESLKKTSSKIIVMDDFDWGIPGQIVVIPGHLPTQISEVLSK